MKVSDETLNTAPWYIALVMCGEQAIERHTKFPKSFGTISDLAAEEEVKSVVRWTCGKHFDAPDVAYIMKECVEETLSILTEQEFEVIVPYYYDGCTQKEIGKELEIAQSTVSKMLASAKEKILSKNQ